MKLRICYSKLLNLCNILSDSSATKYINNDVAFNTTGIFYFFQLPVISDRTQSFRNWIFILVCPSHRNVLV